MATDIKEIFKNLQKATDEKVKHMSEGAFKELFLPMFLNQEDNPHGLVMANWIEYAGSPLLPVHIVDENEKIIFTVPPISNRNALNELGTLDKNGRPMAPIVHILTTYSQLVRSGPTVGENYLNGEFSKRFSLMKQDVDYLEMLRVWKSIFDRYGYTDVIPLDLGPSPTSTNKPQLSQSDDHVEITDL